MNPSKCLYSLGFIQSNLRLNLDLNLDFYEIPLPRFNSAPPHLWKGVRIDIEGRWLESRIRAAEEKKQIAAYKIVAIIN